MFEFVSCVEKSVLWCGLPMVGGRQRQSSANMFLSTKLIALLNFAARYCGIKVYARLCVLKKVNIVRLCTIFDSATIDRLRRSRVTHGAMLQAALAPLRSLAWS